MVKTRAVHTDRVAGGNCDYGRAHGHPAAQPELGLPRVASTCHRDGCNGAFLDGHSDLIQTEKTTELMWQLE